MYVRTKYGNTVAKVTGKEIQEAVREAWRGSLRTVAYDFIKGARREPLLGFESPLG